MGEVYAVKPLGVLAMIDEGELDWKVVCIRADDPKAKEVDDVGDVEKVFPVRKDVLETREGCACMEGWGSKHRHMLKCGSLDVSLSPRCLLMSP